PCGIVQVREIGFLGLPEAGSDYLDVVIRRGKERLVAQALVNILFGELSSCWDTLALKDIPAESAFLAHFVADLHQRGKHYESQVGSFCPGVRLPDNFDTF